MHNGDRGDLMTHPATAHASQGDPSAQNVYTDVYRILLGGMYASTAFYILGVISALLHPQFVPIDQAWVRRQYQWQAIVHGLAHFDQTSLMMVGTLLLILTPVLRVLVSIYAFFVDRDYKYVGVTSVVFVVIVLTVILARMGLS